MFGWIENVRRMDSAKLASGISALNTVNGILLALAGVWSFAANVIDPPKAVVSVYTIVFGLMLLSFQVPLKGIQNYLVLNYGFMFSWVGRAFFLFFCGVISCTLGVVGIIIGAVTFVNLLVNVIGMKYNAGLRAVMTSSSSGKAAPSQPQQQHEQFEVWEEVVDPDSGDTYYYNPSTGQTSWTKPE